MSSNSTSKAGSSAGEGRGIDRSTAHVGLVCTHALELKTLIGRLDRRRRYSDDGMRFTGGFLDATVRVAVVEAGAGFAAHRMAASILVKEHSPAWIVSTGFSSSLVDEVRAGDLSLATEICDTHGQQLNLNCPLPESKHATLRRHLVADKHPTTSDQKHQLADSTSASAVDTTSLAVAQICGASGTPCLSIRAIVDDLKEEVPDSVVKVLFEPTSTRTSVSHWLSGLRQPEELKRWISRAETVSEHLDQFLSGVVRQLAEHLEQS